MRSLQVGPDLPDKPHVSVNIGKQLIMYLLKSKNIIVSYFLLPILQLTSTSLPHISPPATCESNECRNLNTQL